MYSMYFSQLTANFSIAYNTISDNASAAIASADSNLTTYINNASGGVEVAISNFTVAVLTDPDAGNCSIYANASLALLSYFANEVQKCQDAMDKNTTAIYANISSQVSVFGEIYNKYVLASDQCSRTVCSSWLCYFQMRLTRDESRVPMFLSCQEAVS